MTSSKKDDLGALGEVGAILARVVLSGRISPSYLFEGADPGDAREAALLFATALLAGGKEADPALRRRVLSLDHPDVHVLEKDKPTVISVAALQTVLEEAHRTPMEGRFQVFIVDPAEAMEAEGVARYLKALEEPPPGTVFALVTTRPDRLPQTVLSRVRRVRVPPKPASRIAQSLREEGVEEASARRLARYSGGSLGRARRLAQADLARHAEALVTSKGATVSSVEGVLRALEREAAGRVERGEGIDKRQEVRQLLQDLLHILGCEARDRAAGRAAPLLDHLDEARALGALRDAGKLAGAVALNVTPSVILLEAARRFGKA